MKNKIPQELYTLIFLIANLPAWLWMGCIGGILYIAGWRIPDERE